MSSITNRTVAIVDPVAAGGPFGAETRAMGHQALGVLSRDLSTTPYAAQSFQKEEFAEIYRHERIADTIAFLAERKTAAIVPGTQPALEFTDLFADALGLVGNPIATMAARFNKRVMKDHWNAAGVPCAAHFESCDLGEVMAWAQRQGYPVVLKPNASVGGCHVFVCADEREIEHAYRVITSEPDVFGNRFDSVLVEEYLDGTEYFIDLLHNGEDEVELISAARYEKVQRDGHASIYRSFRSLALDDPVVLEALPRIRAANTALGVRYGISDTEYKLTSRGLRVIEMNNRLPGAGTPAMIQRCSGLNCFQESVRIFLGDYVPPPGGYRFARHYSACCLINDRAGRVVGYDGADEIRRLPSFEGMRLIAGVGKDWPATEDLATAWGLVWLVHESQEQLDRDTEAVHALMRLRVE